MSSLCHSTIASASSPRTLPTLTRSSLSPSSLHLQSASFQSTRRPSHSILSTKPLALTARSVNSSMTTPTTKPASNIFNTEEEMAVSLAKYTAQLSERFVRERGAFTVVLSGGSLINSLRKLAEPPYADTIEWGRWHVFWVDERVVPKDHQDSNYKLAMDGFLSKVPIPAHNVYAINDALSAEGAADEYETCLKQLVKTKVVDLSSETGFPKFDLMLLGMGPDGHVASLFPGHPLVNETQRWVTFIKDSPKPPPNRITFTLPVINSSAKIAMVVVGAGKSDVVRRALGSDDTGTDLLPVQMLLPEITTWFVDKEAASKL